MAPPPLTPALAARARELLGGGGIRMVTVAAAFGCSRVMVWHLADGSRPMSLRPGTAGRRFAVLLAALAAAQRYRADADAELKVMDGEGHGERWEIYERGWVWRRAPEGPRVVRAAGRLGNGLLLRDGVRQPGRPVDPAGQQMASGAHR